LPVIGVCCCYLFLNQILIILKISYKGSKYSWIFIIFAH
jgi:hypothetical protein